MKLIKINEEILRSVQGQMIDKAKFTYAVLGKAFERETKRVEDQEKIFSFKTY